MFNGSKASAIATAPATVNAVADHSKIVLVVSVFIMLTAYYKK